MDSSSKEEENCTHQIDMENISQIRKEIREAGWTCSGDQPADMQHSCLLVTVYVLLQQEQVAILHKCNDEDQPYNQHSIQSNPILFVTER